MRCGDRCGNGRDTGNEQARGRRSLAILSAQGSARPHAPKRGHRQLAAEGWAGCNRPRRDSRNYRKAHPPHRRMLRRIGHTVTN
ncbi:hypothetical protein CBM2599_B140103 [Cupriavidus taiwanensis]|nr:hypothetical protein CBM2599_B140103 [Cupriavidus taiwanensis]SOY99535.1 hypothetical protein CBM2600_B60260 [Cupriavidus taiwanensis]